MTNTLFPEDGLPERPGPKGHYAAAPSQIPIRGLREVFWRVLSEFSQDRVMLVAAGITYYLLLALVPSLTALVSIFSFFADPATIGVQVQQLNAIIPGGAIDIIDEQLTRLTSQDETALGFAFILSLTIALWSTNAGIKALFDGMNVAYNEHEDRSFMKLTAVSLSFTLILIVSAITAVSVMIVLPVVFAFVGMDEGTEWLVQMIGFGLLIGLVSLFLALLYRWGPSRDPVLWRWITPGSIFATVTIIAASVGFSFYVANFGSYNATYGSLGAIIGFMTWIWICTTLILLGAEINSELEAQTKLDTTKGEDQSLPKNGDEQSQRQAKTEAVSPSGQSTESPHQSHGQQGTNWGIAALALPVAASLAWLAIKERR